MTTSGQTMTVRMQGQTEGFPMPAVSFDELLRFERERMASNYLRLVALPTSDDEPAAIQRQKIGYGALEGDPQAMSHIGALYIRKRDYSEALRCLMLAIDHSGGRYCAAQLHLGVMRRNGWGIQQDNRKAANWFRRAIRKGKSQPAKEALRDLISDGLIEPTEEDFALSGLQEKLKYRFASANFVDSEYNYEVIPEKDTEFHLAKAVEAYDRERSLGLSAEQKAARVDLILQALQSPEAGIRRACDQQSVNCVTEVDPTDGAGSHLPTEVVEDAYLPTVAPEKYNSRQVNEGLGRKENIVEFLNRVYSEQIKKGNLSRPYLLRVDPAAYTALDNWNKYKNREPSHRFHLPTKSELVDRELTHMDRAQNRKAQALESAARRRGI